jgi:hypothetical protein
MSSHRHYERRPSPPNAPPIATLSSTNSPTPSVSSLDRSSVSTPPMSRRSPPHSHAAPPYYASHAQTYYSHPPPPPVSHHQNHRGYDSHEGVSYAVPSAHLSSVDHTMGGSPTLGGSMPMGAYGLPMPMPYSGGPISSNIPVVYTEDAATKLSDRVRRRCFNCCTTDTSTWRRSNLSPGKVLCNKCGLFERTHSRPRPEQFPHKRGPLAVSTLRSRSPPLQSHAHTLPPPGHAPQGSPPMSNTLPPISSSPYSYAHPPHPSLAPLNSVASHSSNGSHRRGEEHRRPWQDDHISPLISKRSPPSGRASPAPATLSSGSSIASTKPLHTHHERDHDEA